MEKFIAEHKARFVETDFAWMAEWGFDFVRLPMDYRCWARQDEWSRIDEEELKQIDEAVRFGETYGVHVSLSFHRAPGYSVNPNPPEPVSLWRNEEAQEAFAEHWRTFAKRYQGIPNERVSFNLVNEPSQVPEDVYVRVALRAIEAIRDADPDRLIISDGLQWGRQPIHGLSSHGIAQSTRGYDPMPLTHYKAGWVEGAMNWPEPEWPLTANSTTWDKERLRVTRIAPWLEVAAKGVGVHVGECGAFNSTPHHVTLAWLRDNLELWKEAGWGWALWNFRGAFGVLDSQRSDVHYDDFRGHALDRQMLDLLRAN
ncbi:MAG: hypothetical protein AMXMBFR4_31680 [Candidatus Hydrogenedentota bacterium]